MPTTVVKTIQAAGGDFTTPQAWEDAAPANLVTADQIWQGQLANANFGGTGVRLTVAGSTVDSTHYKELICQSGASFKDNANKLTNALRYNTSNGASLSTTSNYIDCISVTENYFRMSGVQVSATAASCGALNMANTGSLVEQCIFEGQKSDGVFVFSSDTGLLRNVLVVGRKSSMTALIKVSSCPTAFNAYGCTFAVPSNLTACAAGINGNYSPNRNWIDCAFFGVTAVKSGTSTDTYTTCGTSAGSPPTGVTGSLANTTATFKGVTDGSHDYRLAAGSALIDTGTTSGTLLNDIVGTSRGASCDIGCWEAAVTGTLKTINGLAKASIKTILGLAIGSIKTVDGLTP